MRQEFDVLAIEDYAVEVPMQLVCILKPVVQFFISGFFDQPIFDGPEIQIGFVPHSSSFGDGLEHVGDDSPVCFGRQRQVSR